MKWSLGSCPFGFKNKKPGAMTSKWSGTDFVHVRAPIPPHASTLALPELKKRTWFQTGIMGTCQLELKEIWTLHRAPPSIWFDMRISWYAMKMNSHFFCALRSPTCLLFYKYPSLSWIALTSSYFAWTILNNHSGPVLFTLFLEDGKSSERQGDSVWWNWCAHIYKVCSRPFRGQSTWLFCFLLWKDRSRASISFLLKGSFVSRYIFTRAQKWPKTRFLRLLTPFFSKTGANSLLPSLDSTGKNLSKSVIIGLMPKSMSDSGIGLTMRHDRL